MSESDYSDVDYMSKPVWCRNKLTSEVFQKVSCPMVKDKLDETSTAASSDVEKPVLYEPIRPEIKKVEKVFINPLQISHDMSDDRSQPKAPFVVEENFNIDSKHDATTQESKYEQTMNELSYTTKEIDIPDVMSFRERRESLDDYSIARLPKVYFKPTESEETLIQKQPFTGPAPGALPTFGYDQGRYCKTFDISCNLNDKRLHM